MSGFRADTDRLGAVGERVAGMASRVDEIRAKADDAVVPAISWGLIGQPIAWTVYRSMVDDFARLAEQLAEGVRNAGEHLGDTAKTYEAAERAVVDGLAAAVRGLDRAAGPEGAK